MQPIDQGILLKDTLESGLAYQDKSHCFVASYAGAQFENSITRKQRTMVAEPIRVGVIGSGGLAQVKALAEKWVQANVIKPSLTETLKHAKAQATSANKKLTQPRKEADIAR